MPLDKSLSTLSDTDLCVMCGMCLPHCPTYQLYQTEMESPRGRLALIQSIDQGKLEADSKALTHIDHCLGCLNCETICPSAVPYGQIIDTFRDRFQSQIPKSLTGRQLLTKTSQANGLDGIIRILQAPGIKQLFSLRQRVSRQPSLDFSQGDPLKHHYSAEGSKQGHVYLFTGCTGKDIDRDTLSDACRLLNKLGYEVTIPDQQYCCGALHQHNGDLNTAQMLRTQQYTLTREAGDAEAILFFSPACGASLKELGEHKIRDVRDFLLDKLNTSKLSFTEARHPVALHESCSHRNHLKAGDLNRQLLSLIPGLEIQFSRQPALCCGAGGLQAFNYPEQAQALATGKLQSFDLSKVNTLLSDNIGCSMHIKSVLKRYNPEIEVIHPISLLKRQLSQS